MKKIVKIISLILSVVMLAGLVPFQAMAAPASEKYPYVFVHGMLGWGYDDSRNNSVPYWGYLEGDLLKKLTADGYEVYAASVGGISSAWDRACELYAQLTGTTVDYGAAHSAQAGHLRFGRSYAGNAIMNNFGSTDKNGNPVKINLIGHSFGGATLRLFAYILEYGCPEELAASGSETSDFFNGGKGKYINSVATFGSPNNGSITADFLYDTMMTALFLSFVGNVTGITKIADYWDFRLEQWELTSVPEQGIYNRMNIKKIVEFASSKDNCGYDLSVDGAEALNAKIDTVDGIYYFCYSGTDTVKTPFGTYIPRAGMNPLFILSSLQVGSCKGKDYGQSYTFTDEWQENDGIVPVKSAQNPIDERYIVYTDGITHFETGVWYVMPVIQGICHTGYMGMSYKNYADIYYNHIRVLSEID